MHKLKYKAVLQEWEQYKLGKQLGYIDCLCLMKAQDFVFFRPDFGLGALVDLIHNIFRYVIILQVV